DRVDVALVLPPDLNQLDRGHARRLARRNVFLQALYAPAALVPHTSCSALSAISGMVTVSDMTVVSCGHCGPNLLLRLGKSVRPRRPAPAHGTGLRQAPSPRPPAASGSPPAASLERAEEGGGDDLVLCSCASTGSGTRAAAAAGGGYGS